MMKSLKIKLLLFIITANFLIQSCTQQSSLKPSESPSLFTSAIETTKSIQFVTPTVKICPSPTSSIEVTKPHPLATTLQTIAPSVTTIVPTPQNKTYLVPLPLPSGKATAYLTLNITNVSGKILVNFQDIVYSPTKINLIDQFGNNIVSSTTFSVAMSGSFSATFSKQQDQLIKKLQLFFFNGKILEIVIDDSFLSVSPEATPMSPNPTPVATTLQNYYQQRNINDDLIVSTISSIESFGIAVDNNGNIYVADFLYDSIKKITPDGVVSTIATGFNGPNGVAVDNSGNVYVADTNNNAIKKITPVGVVSTIATGFNAPLGIAVDSNGNVYVSHFDNKSIKKITPDGFINDISSGFYSYGIAVDSNGNIYASDISNNAIKKITPAGIVTNLVGGVKGYLDGSKSVARFNFPKGLAIDKSGTIYVADSKIRKIR